MSLFFTAISCFIRISLVAKFHVHTTNEVSLYYAQRNDNLVRLIWPHCSLKLTNERDAFLLNIDISF